MPWAHGPEVEAICRRYAELRYRLLPYTYTLAWQAHTRGLPLMRPLVLNYPDDPRVWTLGHEFLWGDDLLVAPVTREGATAWPVYLPAGRWYDFWTGARHEGPAASRSPRRSTGCRSSSGPARSCRWARRPAHRRAAAGRGDPPDLPGAGTSRFELYEDDGRSNAYRAGATR